jgi:hypothetical protein
MKKKVLTVCLLSGILLLALALRIFPMEGLTRGGLNYSEGSMIRDAARPASQMLGEIPPDQAPMKYYFLKGMLRLGRSEFLINFPSLLFDLLSILLLFYLGEALFGRKAAVLACFFMAVSMWNIHHATLARGYPLYAFSSILSTLFLYRAVEDKKPSNWILYGLAQAFSFYSFYPSLFILAAQLCWFFVYYGQRRDLTQRLLGSLGLSFVIAIPLLLHAVTAFHYRLNFGNGLWGLQDFGEIARAVLEHLGGLRGPVPLGVLVAGWAFVWLFYVSKQRKQALLLALLVAVPILSYVLFFYAFRMCIVPRLFFHTYPFFLLLAAAGVASWRHWVWRVAGILVFILPLCLYGFHQRGWTQQALFPPDYERQNDHFSAVAKAIQDKYERTSLDYVAVVPWPALFFIQYYLDKSNRSPVMEYLSGPDHTRYAVYEDPQITIYGMDGHLSLLQVLAAAGRLLVVDVVSGNLSTLPGGAEAVAWLRKHAHRTEHNAGADFYFITPPAALGGDYKISSAAAKRELFLRSQKAGQSNFTGWKT